MTWALPAIPPALCPVVRGEPVTENNNIFHVQDLSEVSALIQAVKEETDPDARTQAVKALEDWMAQERPFIPLWFGTGLHVESPTVSGIEYTAASFSKRERVGVGQD